VPGGARLSFDCLPRRRAPRRPVFSSATVRIFSTRGNFSQSTPLALMISSWFSNVELYARNILHVIRLICISLHSKWVRTEQPPRLSWRCSRCTGEVGQREDIDCRTRWTPAARIDSDSPRFTAFFFRTRNFYWFRIL
jgi:hypothetical protein